MEAEAEEESVLSESEEESKEETVEQDKHFERKKTKTKKTRAVHVRHLRWTMHLTVSGSRLHSLLFLIQQEPSWAPPQQHALGRFELLRYITNLNWYFVFAFLLPGLVG